MLNEPKITKSKRQCKAFTIEQEMIEYFESTEEYEKMKLEIIG